MNALRFLGLVVLLNLIRYFIGGPIEALLLMEPMHAVMPKFPEAFNIDFTTNDFLVSIFYNFMLWFFATLMFHVAHPAMKGNMVIRSLKVFGIMGLFFISLAAIYMNHYVPDIRTFYLYSMLDAIILFPLVGAANGLLYPLIMPKKEVNIE